MPAYTVDRPKVKLLGFFHLDRNNRRRDLKLCTVMLNRMRRHRGWAIDGNDRQLDFTQNNNQISTQWVQFIWLNSMILWKFPSVILTSMPISVGRMYKLAFSVCGTHSWSIDTSRCIDLIYSSPSNVGNPERLADKFMRFIFIFGRKMRIFPSTPRYAFMPSNNCRKGKKRRSKIRHRKLWKIYTLIKFTRKQWKSGHIFFLSVTMFSHYQSVSLINTLALLW